MSRVSALVNGSDESRPWPIMQGRGAGWISGPMMDIIICNIFATKLHCVHPSSLDQSAVSVKIPAAAARGRPVPGSGSGPGALQLQLWSRPPEETGIPKKHLYLVTNATSRVLEKKAHSKTFFYTTQTFGHFSNMKLLHFDKTYRDPWKCSKLV